MALVVGTNCGFVETAPTSDPRGRYDYGEARRIFGFKDVAPVGAVKIVEIGWWMNTTKTAGTVKVGIYDHNSGDNEPENLLTGSDSFTRSSTAGWQVKTGLNIAVTAEDTYWIAFWDEKGGEVDQDLEGGTWATRNKQSGLIDPFGTADAKYTRRLGIYAVYETAATGTNTQINIGDDWKDIAAAKVNIGDVWKDVAGMQVNIGDTWKEVF